MKQTATAPRRFLIVDDHGIIRDALRDSLRRAYPGCMVEEAVSYPEAMAALCRHPWDLVLLDLNLPGRGGLELLWDSREQRGRTPVLVLTMYSEDAFGVRALRLGASGYLQKGAGQAAILGAVEDLLAGRRHVPPALAQTLLRYVQSPEDRPRHELLSERELQVMRCIARGQSMKMIGNNLNLSVKTISTYRSRILQKLGVHSNAEMIGYCFKHELVEQ
jgi:two-component system, NarL family, invasion response regulator UvrY